MFYRKVAAGWALWKMPAGQKPVLALHGSDKGCGCRVTRGAISLARTYPGGCYLFRNLSGHDLSFLAVHLPVCDRHFPQFLARRTIPELFQPPDLLA